MEPSTGAAPPEDTSPPEPALTMRGTGPDVGHPPATGAALLARHMRRRGWSPARLADIAGGVSASSIRSYAADRSIPRPQQALAVANALGPREGRTLLEAWGYSDLATGFYDSWRQAVIASDDKLTAIADEYYRFNKIEYPGEPLTDAGIEILRANAVWIQHLEALIQARRRRTTPGDTSPPEK